MLEYILLILIPTVGVILYFKRKINKLKEDFEIERDLIKIDAKKRSGAVQWGKTIEHFVLHLYNYPSSRKLECK